MTFKLSGWEYATEYCAFKDEQQKIDRRDNSDANLNAIAELFRLRNKAVRDKAARTVALDATVRPPYMAVRNNPKYVHTLLPE